MKIPPPIIRSNRTVARQEARGHQPALQPSEGHRAERLDTSDVPERQRVCRHSDKGSGKAMNKDSELWVITSRNRLTGEDYVISSPMGKEQALRLMKQQKRKNHSHSSWSRLKVVPAIREGNLF